MKTLKQILVFFATFFGLFAMLNGAIALLIWETLYNVIHSAASFLTFIVSLICAIMVTAEYSENE
jgi:heme A synthase